MIDSYIFLYHMNVFFFIVAALILKEVKGNRGEVAVLMGLLLFDEIACIETWLVYIFSPWAIMPFSYQSYKSDFFVI